MCQRKQSARDREKYQAVKEGAVGNPRRNWLCLMLAAFISAKTNVSY